MAWGKLTDFFAIAAAELCFLTGGFDRALGLAARVRLEALFAFACVAGVAIVDNDLDVDG